MLPYPLDTALGQLWGYASNGARHLVEGREPDRAEAELLVESGGDNGDLSWEEIRKGEEGRVHRFLLIRRVKNGSTMSRAFSCISS
jgi:hypothetical protein